MSRRPTPLPPSLGSVFTTAEALAAGVGRGRLQGTDLERLIRGVYRIRPFPHRIREEHPSAAWRRRQWERINLLVSSLPHHTFFSGTTAAVIWGAPVPPTTTDDLEVGAFAPRRPPRKLGIHGTTYREHLVTVTIHRGLRVVTPASLWCTLGPRLSRDERVALGDSLIHEARVPGTRRLEAPALTTVTELAATMSRGRRPGIVALREALPLLSTQSASPPETHLRLRCREWGLPVPALDFDVRNAHGRLLGASELAFPKFRVALEYEGDHHRTSVRQWNRDIEKQQAYAAAGWTMIRVTARMLYREPHRLRAAVATALRARGWSHPG